MTVQLLCPVQVFYAPASEGRVNYTVHVTVRNATDSLQDLRLRADCAPVLPDGSIYWEGQMAGTEKATLLYPQNDRLGRSSERTIDLPVSLSPIREGALWLFGQCAVFLHFWQWWVVRPLEIGGSGYIGGLHIADLMLPE